jgi:excisionase family DNA binding protein
MSIQSTGLSHHERRSGGLKPLTVTVRAASQLTGLSVRTIWSLIKTGRIDVARVGGRTLPKFESLERLLASDADSPQPERGAAADPPGRRPRKPRHEPAAVITPTP